MRRALAAILVLAAAGCGGDGEPAAKFTSTQELGSRTQVEVTFESRGVELRGVLDLPSTDGPHPAIVWVHGSGREKHDANAPTYTRLLDPRFAVLAYDKRGVGRSEGECCPLDFDLLADDVVAAVDALRTRDDIDGDSIGLLGLSQGGWIIPVAATKSDEVSFAISLSGPAVSLGEEDLYSDLTGDDTCDLLGNPPALISKLVMAEKPSGFDPRPYLARLEIPVLWLYGTLDQSQPVEKDLTVLRPLKRSGKDFTVVVFPQTDHILELSKTGGKCIRGHGGRFPPRLASTLNGWLRRNVE